MLNSFLLLIAGFVLLGVGAETLVRGSSQLAIRLGIAPMVVGLTIVAFGTSAPELAVSIDAALSDKSALALGNVVGSNIANIGLILGVTALISPITIEASLVRRQVPLMIGVSLLLCLLLIDDVIGFMDGLILVSGLLAYLGYNYFSASTNLNQLEESFDPSQFLPVKPGAQNSNRFLINFILIVGGLALLIYGSHIFVASAVVLAELFGVSEAVIGLTIVAVGTSVPELATSVIAALRKQPDIAVGNVIGSNLFNILAILGITALISSISAVQFSVVDLGIMVVFAAALLPIAWSKLTLTRLEGAGLLAGYFGYITYLIV